MHRYRDAIVYRSVVSPCFFKSIDKVNVGGLPFLPSSTSMVTDMLDQLIAGSPASAFERTALPRAGLYQLSTNLAASKPGPMGRSRRAEMKQTASLRQTECLGCLRNT
ncbi:MAG: hypothetical protein K2O45_17320 [Oscillospiraceae bacterium]|nr:hypothetical protein [Oscillospiraceae bacterium]